MIKLFELDKTNKALLNKEWIRMIPEFNRLIVRDKGGDSDKSGRYKVQATKEFTFIFLMYDFKSKLENYSLEERFRESVRWSGIDDTKIDKDEDLQAAIKVYRELLDNSSKTLQVYRTLKGTVDNLSLYLRDIDLNERNKNDAKVHSIKDVQDSIIKMGATLKALAELEDEVKKEFMEDIGMRGDAIKGESEDPDDEDIN